MKPYHSSSRAPGRACAALLGALIFAGATAAGAQATQAPPSALPKNPEVRTMEFFSESVGRDARYDVVLPSDYETSDKTYPVLYLLHGLTSNYTAWPRLGVPFYMRGLDLIVVSPDAGNSWFLNWTDVEGDKKELWEDHIIKEVIPHVDANFRTVAGREGRAINGLSMGGYGAIMLGLRYPDMFCSIGSHSGALRYADRFRGALKRNGKAPRPTRRRSEAPNPMLDMPGFSSQADRTPQGRAFTSLEDLDAHDPYKLVLEVPREKLPHIYIDCGTEDSLIGQGREFMLLLMNNDIAFTFAQSEGGHRPPYWAREVGHSMAVQYQILRRNLGFTLRPVPMQRPPRQRGRVGSIDLPMNWPPKSAELDGENEVVFTNPNDFAVLVGLRSSEGGKDAAVEPNSEATLTVPDGQYATFFLYTNERDAFYRGEPLALNGHGVHIKIGTPDP